MDHPAFECIGLTKEFGDRTALSHVTLTLAAPSIIGLIGRNGAGKTTLLHHMVGLLLPTRGQTLTFGVPSQDLEHDHLARIGFVPHAPSFISWMTVNEHLAYLASFYPRWDTHRASSLLDTLDLDGSQVVGRLSAGDQQKLAVISAVCHHPSLLLLDEPLHHLDPIARERLLLFLLQVVDDDGATVVVSSHILHDIESLVDWIVCLDAGTLAVSDALDSLKERFVGWRVQARSRDLPARFADTCVRHQAHVSPRSARLVVHAGSDSATFSATYDVDVAIDPVNLEGMFTALTHERPRS